MQTVREHINSMQWAHKGEQKEIHEALENIHRKLVHGTHAFPVHSECTGNACKTRSIYRERTDTTRRNLKDGMQKYCTRKAWGNRGNVREREENRYRTYNGSHGKWSRKKQGITVKTLAQWTKTIHWEPTRERGDLRMTTWTGSAKKPKENAPGDEWRNVSKEGKTYAVTFSKCSGNITRCPPISHGELERRADDGNRWVNS